LQLYLVVDGDELLTYGSGGGNFIFGSTTVNERKQANQDRRKENTREGKSE
jgi:hypothetical protein